MEASTTKTILIELQIVLSGLSKLVDTIAPDGLEITSGNETKAPCCTITKKIAMTQSKMDDDEKAVEDAKLRALPEGA